jgi:hypothetical protein
VAYAGKPINPSEDHIREFIPCVNKNQISPWEKAYTERAASLDRAQRETAQALEARKTAVVDAMTLISGEPVAVPPQSS